MKKILAVLLTAVLIFTGCTVKQDEPTPTKNITSETVNLWSIAQSLALDIAQKQYEDAVNNYDYSAEMIKVISPKFYENDIGSLQVGYGEFVKAEEPVSTEKDGYTIYSCPMVFENTKAVYNIVFDSEGKIAGFNIREAEPEGEEPDSSPDVPVTEIALEFAQALMDGRYDEAYENYPHDATMKGAVSAVKYEEMMEAVKLKSGSYLGTKEPFEFELAGYTAVDVPIQTSGESFNIEIYFDNKNNIAGLKFVPYQEKQEQAQMPSTITETELSANVNGITLGGTLTVPKDGENFPCVVLVHGSGPNDRDETINMNRPFRDIAWGLASRGIAVYRYDKRSYVYNADFKTGYDLTLAEETVDDAAEISKMLSKVEGIDADKIYILGHSIGGYAIPRIAIYTPNAAGYIIMAGSVSPVYELIPKQYEYLFNLDGKISDAEQASIDKVYEDYEKIKNIEDYDKADVFMGMYKAYIEDMKAYDPIGAANEIIKPVLVLQGERDYQVPLTEYNMWINAFEDSPNWKFNLYPKLNHLMMAGEGPANNAEYSIQSHVDETLISDIAEFILSK